MRYIGIIILLVLCLTLLLLTGCIVNPVIPETAIGNLENQENTEEPIIENTEEPVMWSGLGIDIENLVYIETIPEFDSYVDTLLANGFTQIRVKIAQYYSDDVDLSKTAALRAIAKGAEVIWGVDGGSTITATNWSSFRQAILDAAQWAQDNGVYEFLLGNEEDDRVDGTTMTQAQIIVNLKAVATDVQAIFTRGNISYTCNSFAISDWVTAGRGDIDILASNVYINGWGNWKTNITNLIAGFGTDHTGITEFSVSGNGLDNYSTDEAVQAAGTIEMIEYIKASGMTRAFYFCYTDTSWLPGRGVLKADGTYRLLWSQALLNSESVKFATVPTKTTIASLPGTQLHLYQE